MYNQLLVLSWRFSIQSIPVEWNYFDKTKNKVLGDNLSKTKGEIREHVGDPAIYGLRTMEGNWLLLFSGMAADLETSQTCSQCSQFSRQLYSLDKEKSRGFVIPSQYFHCRLKNKIFRGNLLMLFPFL